MDIRRRNPMPPVSTVNNRRKPTSAIDHSPSTTPKASDALPLPLYLTNGIFFTLFFSVAYYLLHRWRDKIRTSTPLHVVTFTELAAILSLIASFIYLLGFFGIDFVQSFVARSSNDAWDADVDVDDPQRCIVEEDRRRRRRPPVLAGPVTPSPRLMDPPYI